MKKKTFFFLLFLINTALYSAAPQDPDKEAFYMDALIFKGDNPDSSRVDFFCVIPNETLHFVNTEKSFVAKYELIVNIIDTLNLKVISKRYERALKADDYIAAQSGNSEYSKVQDQYYLPKGNYKINVILHDLLSQNEYDKSRMLTLVNFSDYPFASSGVLLLSSIEENEQKFIITPHISDNIGTLHNGYFAFMEVYNNLNIDKINIHSEIIDNDKKEIVYTDNTAKNIKNGTNQIYVRFPNTIAYGKKTNTLKITVQEVETDTNRQKDARILAAAQRSIKNISYILTKITTDLENAIRQLRYVANDVEMKSIKEAKNEKEKLKRFEEFWRKLDPTPNSERNEAMEEYYYRVDYSNKNFKSYAEGWLTDKGSVFIVYGAPNAIDRSNSSSYSSSKVYEKWTYFNNRTFIFYDATGFGDFRLSNPTFVTEKYEYKGI